MLSARSAHRPLHESLQEVRWDVPDDSRHVVLQLGDKGARRSGLTRFVQSILQVGSWKDSDTSSLHYVALVNQNRLWTHLRQLANLWIAPQIIPDCCGWNLVHQHDHSWTTVGKLS